MDNPMIKPILPMYLSPDDLTNFGGLELPPGYRFRVDLGRLANHLVAGNIPYALWYNLSAIPELRLIRIHFTEYSKDKSRFFLREVYHIRDLRYILDRCYNLKIVGVKYQGSDLLRGDNNHRHVVDLYSVNSNQ